MAMDLHSNMEPLRGRPVGFLHHPQAITNSQLAGITKDLLHRANSLHKARRRTLEALPANILLSRGSAFRLPANTLPNSPSALLPLANTLPNKVTVGLLHFHLPATILARSLLGTRLAKQRPCVAQ
jgi:hypothetical protein